MGSGGSPNHQHFGMSGRIMVGLNPIPRGRHDSPRLRVDQNGANRHFASVSGLPCLIQS